MNKYYIATYPEYISGEVAWKWRITLKRPDHSVQYITSADYFPQEWAAFSDAKSVAKEFVTALALARVEEFEYSLK